MKSSKKTFTLVELIIVIAIIAILAVTAFLLLTKWLAKARDSSRASNLANIENSLQVSLTENSSLPKPDSYTLIYASGTSNVIGYQGYFGEGAKDTVGNINSAPKDGDDYFTYYLNADLNKYQLASFMENEISYNPNVVSAVDYSSRYINVRGDKLGLLTDSNKSPLQTLGLTGLNILSGDRTYIAYYDNSTKLNLSGQTLITMLSLGNKNSAQYDTGLVGYRDMETTINSGGLLMLKDLSGKGNNGTCYNSGTLVNCGQSGGPIFKQTDNGKGMEFRGENDFVSGGNFKNFLSGEEFTIIAKSKIYKWKQYGIIAGTNGVNNGGYLETYPGTFVNSSYTDKIYYNYWINVGGSPNAAYSTGALYGYNEFHTITGRYSKSLGSQSLFVDGTSIASASRSSAFILTDAIFYIGGNATNSHFNGTIDEVRVYNRSLSDAEIKVVSDYMN